MIEPMLAFIIALSSIGFIVGFFYKKSKKEEYTTKIWDKYLFKGGKYYDKKKVR